MSRRIAFFVTLILPFTSLAQAEVPDPKLVGGDMIELKLSAKALRRMGALQDRIDGLGIPGVGPLEPLFARPVERLQEDRVVAARVLGERKAPRLDAWFKLSLAAVPEKKRAEVAEKVVRRLKKDPSVTYVARSPRVAPAVLPGARDDGESCPIKTPTYETLQGYLAPAPGGIDVESVIDIPGGRGAGLWFADVEGGWNAQHEDLPGDRMEHVAGVPIADRGWEAHGTAVVGVVACRDNRIGMIGIARDVDRIFTGSVGEIGAAAALDQTASRLRPGDVLLIELHGPGPNSSGWGQRGYVPMEWWQACFEVIQTHTARGVVIVEAAGNGAENLDDAVYEGKFDRANRDSGAIMIGAGAPLADGFVDRSRLDFSNHGARVDLQGWGRRVATVDYGDLQGCSETSRKYTQHFSGTSSASPVVTGAVLAIQGIHKHRTGQVLGGRQIRDLLVRTGTEQTDGPSGPATENIGPRPDLRRAIAELLAK